MSNREVPKKVEKETFSVSFSVLIPVLLVLYPFLRSYLANDPISYIKPNLMLFTNMREETREEWKRVLKFDTGVEQHPAHVPTIDAADFSLEKLRIATENWRYPAVVRGLFANTSAVQKWTSGDYLSSAIGDFVIPVVNNGVVNTLQNDRGLEAFRDAYAHILDNEDSKKYLFFPVKSRFSLNHSDAGSLEALSERINELVLKDLEVDKLIWNGFGTKTHKNYFGSQLIIGRGSADTEETTGTGWHCAPGNNWFVQVAGRKRWFFMDPKYSAHMFPLRGGKVNMQAGNKELFKYQKYLKLRYADVNTGDLLYNPDWEWHTIQNYEGLSIGVPIREFNVSLSFQNNQQYTAIVLINKFLEKFGMDIGGYAPNN